MCGPRNLHVDKVTYKSTRKCRTYDFSSRLCDKHLLLFSTPIFPYLFLTILLNLIEKTDIVSVTFFVAPSPVLYLIPQKSDDDEPAEPAAAAPKSDKKKKKKKKKDSE